MNYSVIKKQIEHYIVGYREKLMYFETRKWVIKNLNLLRDKLMHTTVASNPTGYNNETVLKDIDLLLSSLSDSEDSPLNYYLVIGDYQNHLGEFTESIQHLVCYEISPDNTYDLFTVKPVVNSNQVIIDWKIENLGEETSYSIRDIVRDETISTMLYSMDSKLLFEHMFEEQKRLMSKYTSVDDLVDSLVESGNKLLKRDVSDLVSGEYLLLEEDTKIIKDMLPVNSKFNKICKSCGEYFELDVNEVMYYDDKGLNHPRRCKDCRGKRTRLVHKH